MKTGVVLINLGSPKSTSVADVRKYLAELLGDRHVLDLKEPWRSLLLYGVILPTRPKKTAALYRNIWRDDGSPLLSISRAQVQALQAAHPDQLIRYASRYGEPRLKDVLEELSPQVTRVVFVPLYPQYATAATHTATEEALRLMSDPRKEVCVTAPFFEDAGFIAAQAERIEAARKDFAPDQIVYSYHGLPVHQVKACASPGSKCCVSADCCDTLREDNARCYRAQCHATSRALDAAQGVSGTPTTFQSRLRGKPWIRPYSDVFVSELAAHGKKRVLVACPSFVSDCLETLEEVGIRLAKQFEKESGGGTLQLVPCVNTHPKFIGTLSALIASAQKVARS
jgi:protoporphyrin/coproporphyrin ferrochelatase